MKLRWYSLPDDYLKEVFSVSNWCRKAALPAANLRDTMPEQYRSITGLVDDLPATPQFVTAEYRKEAPAQLCGQCGRKIGIRSFVLNSNLVCNRCATAATPTAMGHATFARSLVFGMGAAILGLALYASFTIVTHLYLGYVALAVGWLVAKAMMMGSRGVGGIRYQIAAVILTYAAISLASVPILIAKMLQDAADYGTTMHIEWGKVAGKLAGWGIASPFLQLRGGIWGMVGFIILLAGLRIAFRMTAGKKLMYS